MNDKFTKNQKSNKNIVVIGAGIIGSCCALRLTREGHKVTLIDRELPGSGCSYGNAGGISSGSIIPMALPGIWKKVPSWLIDKEGPLSVKWGYLPKASPWLLKWLCSSTEKAAEYSSLALFNLNQNAVQGYKELLTIQQADSLIRHTGHLYTYYKKPLGKGDHFASFIRDLHGIKTEEFYGKEIKDIEPTISSDFKYGLYLPEASFTINPQRLVSMLVKNFQAAGGIFIQNEVKQLFKNEGLTYDITTRTGCIKADAVVIATGSWSKQILPENECSIPLETERGYHIMLHEPNLQPSLPVIAGDYKFFATPMESGLRLAGTVEISGLASLPNWKRAELLLDHAKKVFPGLQAAGSSVWVGNRPSFPSSIPLIDESVKNKNVFYAFGHGHYGLSGAPGTAEIICNLIDKTPPAFDIEPYSLARH